MKLCDLCKLYDMYELMYMYACHEVVKDFKMHDEA